MTVHERPPIIILEEKSEVRERELWGGGWEIPEPMEIDHKIIIIKK